MIGYIGQQANPLNPTTSHQVSPTNLRNERLGIEVQWLRARSALPEDLGLVLNIRFRQVAQSPL